MSAPDMAAALSEDVVAALWSLWTARTYIKHGDYATVDQLLTTARETATLVAGFLGDAAQAEGMFILMQQGIAEALDDAEPPGSARIH